MFVCWVAIIFMVVSFYARNLATQDSAVCYMDFLWLLVVLVAACKGPYQLRQSQYE